MATKAKNAKMTKANQKMLTYIFELQTEMEASLKTAARLKDRGEIKMLNDYWEYSNTSTKWHHALEMFKEVNGLTDHDYFHGNSHQYVYDLRFNK